QTYLPFSLHTASPLSLFFFFNHPPTTQTYTLSLHDALPISRQENAGIVGLRRRVLRARLIGLVEIRRGTKVTGALEQAVGQLVRSEEHTSELQSRENLVCRLLLEKKKKKK